MTAIFSRIEGYFENRLETLKEKNFEVKDFKVNEQEYTTSQEGEEVKACVGSIRKKKDRNVFEGRYYVNKKQYSIYGKSYEEVKQKLVDIYTNKFFLNSTVKTFYTWFSEWFEIYKKPNLKGSSLKNILYCFEKYIKPNFKDCPLNLIKPFEVQEALNKISASRMRKYTYDIFRACLRQAFKTKLITENVAELLEPVKHVEKSGKALTVEEQKILEPFFEQEKYKILKLYLLTGCRPAEGLALKWEDVDYLNEIVHISGTKTKGSDRIIPLFKNLKEFLETVPKTGERIFDLTKDAVKGRVDDLEELTGVKFNTYTLRHTFATRCVEAGIEMKVVSKWLGHTSIKTTANYYVHVLSDFEKSQAEKFKI